MLIICGPGFQFLINFKLIYFLDNDIDKAESGIQETKKYFILLFKNLLDLLHNIISTPVYPSVRRWSAQSHHLSYIPDRIHRDR